MFEVGQQVVCVDAKAEYSFGHQKWLNPLVRGEIYTVLEIGMSPHWPGNLALYLAGNPNTWRVTGEDIGFLASRFRPVAKRSDTLSIESFLTIKDGFEEPRRVVEPVRRKEGV